MPLTVTPATLAAAAAALAGYGSSLATTTAGAAAPTTIIAPAGADTVSIQQAAIFSAFGAQLQAILAGGQDYQTQFETNLGNASDTYSLRGHQCGPDRSFKFSLAHLPLRLLILQTLPSTILHISSVAPAMAPARSCSEGYSACRVTVPTW